MAVLDSLIPLNAFNDPLRINLEVYRIFIYFSKLESLAMKQFP